MTYVNAPEREDWHTFPTVFEVGASRFDRANQVRNFCLSVGVGGALDAHPFFLFKRLEYDAVIKTMLATGFFYNWVFSPTTAVQ